MTTTLCLADIPRRYDLYLEIPQEKDSADNLNGRQAGLVVSLDIESHFPVTSTREWPDSSGIACALFAAFMTNASLLIVWLIIMDEATMETSSNADIWLGSAMYFSIVCWISNLGLAVAARKELKSKVIELAFTCAWTFWLGVLITLMLKIHDMY
jgi:hypothetical protein